MGAGVVICLERSADLHTAQLMPLPLTVSCSSKIQIGFTFLVPAHPGSPRQRAVKRLQIQYICTKHTQLCDPLWHVSSRSGVATLRTAIRLLLTYLWYWQVTAVCGVMYCSGAPRRKVSPEPECSNAANTGSSSSLPTSSTTVDVSDVGNNK